MHEASDVHTLPTSSEEDEALDVPPPPGPTDPVDPFAEFEDELEAEATRIDESQLLAEQSTQIIDELPAQPFLAVEKGNDLGREFVLQEGENGIGRGIDNDVILADVAVSRRHLIVRREGDVLRLKDLGSGNGTQVNGQRTSTTVLTEGDRIEVGETVLVVRVPGASLAAVEPHDHEANTDESHIGQSLPPPAPTATPSDPFAIPDGPGYQPELTPSATESPPLPPSAPKGAVVLPKPVFLAAIAGAAGLLMLMFVTLVVLVVTSGSDDEEQQTVTMQSEGSPYERGVRAFEAHRWDEADAAFRAHLEESGSDPRVNEYLQRIRQAREDEANLARARAALEAGDVNTAFSTASAVNSDDSPLLEDAREVANEARGRLVQQHVEAGRRALTGGDEDQARARLQEARNLDADSALVRAFAAELDGDAPQEGADEPEPELRAEASPEEEASGGSSGAPERAAARGRGIDISDVISAYLAGRFDQAVRLARAGANRARGRERQRLSTLASRIQSFGSLWGRIRAARFGGRVTREMSQAIHLDSQIARNPHYRDQLRPHLVNAHLAEARRRRSSPTQSCTSVRHALAVDGNHAQARRMSAQCESRARQMMSQAQSAPAASAMSLYGQVLLMVPRSSPLYREASSRQQALRRRHTYDEDE